MASKCLSRVKSMVKLLIQSLYNPKYQMSLVTHLWKPNHPLTITHLPNLTIIQNYISAPLLNTRSIVNKPVNLQSYEYSDLTLSVINFRSILNKKAEFLFFLQNAKLKNIIIGTKTWLSRDILDSEIYLMSLTIQFIGKIVLMVMEVS